MRSRGSVLAGARPGSARRGSGQRASGRTHWEYDLRAVAAVELDAIVLPKATPEAVAALGPDGPTRSSRSSRRPWALGARTRPPRRRALRRSSSAPSTSASSSASSRVPTGRRSSTRAPTLVVDSAPRPASEARSTSSTRTRATTEGLEAESLARTLARLPRQGLHPSGPGRGREPRLLADGRGRSTRARRVVEAYERGGAGRARRGGARRRDDRPPRGRARAGRSWPTAERSASDDD